MGEGAGRVQFHHALGQELLLLPLLRAGRSDARVAAKGYITAFERELNEGVGTGES